MVTLTYRPQSEVPFALRQDKGIYAGLIYPAEGVLFELREDGSISGLTSTGCEFSGSASPDGPVAKGSVTFHGFPCKNRNDTVKGAIGVDRQQGRCTRRDLMRSWIVHWCLLGDDDLVSRMK